MARLWCKLFGHDWMQPFFGEKWCSNCDLFIECYLGKEGHLCYDGRCEIPNGS